MGSADRDYFRDEEARYAAGGRRPLPIVTKTLLIANIAIFIADIFTRKDGSEMGAINAMFCFTVRSAFQEWRLWELLTFQFLHGGVLHIVFNSVALFIFGPWIERWWGTGRFIAFYLLCGVAGALFFTLLALTGILPQRGFFPITEVPLVGASAGIFGLMIGTAVLAPNAIVRLLLPPVSLSMRSFALWLIGIAVAIILGDIFFGGGYFKNSGGEAGHLGGAILGFILMRHPALLRKNGKSRAPAKAKVIRPREFRKKRSLKLRPRTEVDTASADEVDRILDKINREGIRSLTEEEREILNKASHSRDQR